MKFGTILVDPPWDYASTSTSTKLSGYSTGNEYASLTMEDLKSLPVNDIADEDAVLLLWTTWPFFPTALEVCKSWGFEYVTGLPWVKIQKRHPDAPTYGVGYWFRGCTEPLLVAKKGKAVRTNWVGLLGTPLKHSQKPTNIYHLAERLPGPRVELFARHLEPGWYGIGNECPQDGNDIRKELPLIIDNPELWTGHKLKFHRPGLSDFSLWLRDGSAPRRIRPTDIDCLFHDSKRSRFMLLEFKPTKDVPLGQRTAFVDFAEQGNIVYIVVDPNSGRFWRKEGVSVLPDDYPLEVSQVLPYTPLSFTSTNVAGLNELVQEFYK